MKITSEGISVRLIKTLQTPISPKTYSLIPFHLTCNKICFNKIQKKLNVISISCYSKITSILNQVKIEENFPDFWVLLSGLLSFEHPSVLLFCFEKFTARISVNSNITYQFRDPSYDSYAFLIPNVSRNASAFSSDFEDIATIWNQSMFCKLEPLLTIWKEDVGF